MKNLIDSVKNEWGKVKTGSKEFYANTKRQFKGLDRFGKTVMVLSPFIIGAVGYGAWQKASRVPLYEVQPVVQADFDRDGTLDMVGYTQDPASSRKRTVLSYINGRHVEKFDIPASGENIPESFALYVPADKIEVIQTNAGTESKRNVANVSAEDVNGDGYPDISYDMTIGTKRHKEYINQKD